MQRNQRMGRRRWMRAAIGVGVAVGLLASGLTAAVASAYQVRVIELEQTSHRFYADLEIWDDGNPLPSAWSETGCGIFSPECPVHLSLQVEPVWIVGSSGAIATYQYRGTLRHFDSVFPLTFGGEGHEPVSSSEISLDPDGVWQRFDWSNDGDGRLQLEALLVPEPTRLALAALAACSGLLAAGRARGRSGAGLQGGAGQRGRRAARLATHSLRPDSRHPSS